MISKVRFISSSARSTTFSMISDHTSYHPDGPIRIIFLTQSMVGRPRDPLQSSIEVHMSLNHRPDVYHVTLTHPI